jgi:predicted acyl esterase
VGAEGGPETCTEESNVIEAKSETRDGMAVGWDLPITMDDGVILRADVFRPIAPGKYPVILSHGPYGKGMAFPDSRPYAWKQLVEKHPEVLEGTSGKYASWEVVDPEKWVPEGYAVVRVDSRGSGRSPGYLDCWSPRETKDLYNCIEWAGTQPWSSGRVGLNGISYFAMNAWHVAALNPPHLAAICAWEGAGDFYRDVSYHGGIASGFLPNWYARAILPLQHGYGERGARSRVTGELVAGPETLPDEELAANRADLVAAVRAHPLDDAFHRSRSAAWDKIAVPLLSAANWGGQGMHLRGNFEGFVRAASERKWLEAHGDAHWTSFYSADGVAMQKRFFGHFLQGRDTGWEKQPRVALRIRHPGEKLVPRAEQEWPLARTAFTRFYLHADESLGEVEPEQGTLAFDALGNGLTFRTRPLARDTEITGPIALQLTVSSSTADADLFAIVRVFAPDGSEVVFQGAQDPRTPIAQGWLRASHRKLDAELSRPYRPHHSHDELWPLSPGEPVELAIEILPTCIVAPAGHTLALTIKGNDYRFDGPAIEIPGVKHPLTGVGPFLHDDPANRPAEIFSGQTRLHLGPDCYLLLPIIPADGRA